MFFHFFIRISTKSSKSDKLICLDHFPVFPWHLHNQQLLPTWLWLVLSACQNLDGTIHKRPCPIRAACSWSLEPTDCLGYHNGKTANFSLVPLFLPRSTWPTISCFSNLSFRHSGCPVEKKTTGGEKKFQRRAKVNRSWQTCVHSPPFCLLWYPKPVMLLCISSANHRGEIR